MNDDLVFFKHQSIGYGARGAVFKGEFRGKPCAVKMLHHLLLQINMNLPLTPGLGAASKAFKRECEFLQSFHHDNVVRHISTERVPMSNNVILVTELMDCNLRVYLPGREGKSLTNFGEVSLCKDVASGLAYIHSRHIIHRDICGDNVLLKLHKPVPIAKISDFGTSKLFKPSDAVTLTALCSRMGYLPPEAQKGEYNKSLDVFSLGVIMIQIVHRLPTVQSAAEQSNYIAAIPSTNRLKPIIENCLHEDPEKRLSSDQVGK